MTESSSEKTIGIPILIAEDNHLMRKILENNLTEAGYRVTSAENGREALALYLQNYFPIVMTDWIMPEMDGLQLCRAIRGFQQEHYTYIILLTSQDSKDDLISGLKAGADEYLIKPVNPTELMVRLKTAHRILDLESSLQKSLAEVKELSIHDPLTGAFNRGFLDQKLPQEIKRAFRYLRNLSVIMVDIDHFKNVNDTHGHQIGDTVLKQCVASMHGSIRKEIDWLARFGGEEFLLVLPETPPQGCLIVAERLRQLIERTPVIVDDKSVSFTASFGVATLVPAQETENITYEQLLKKADDCLYRAKQTGRNKVVSCVVS